MDDDADFDLVYIIDSLKNRIKNVEANILNDLILVLGNTGAGKSTTVNYLLGNEMIYVRDEELECKVVKGRLENSNKYPKIGHSFSQSTTKYPELFYYNGCLLYTSRRG